MEKTYTGCTNNLEQRLNEHNLGKVKSSKPYLPYKILHSEEFLTLQEARRKEKYFKSTSGRRRIKALIEDSSFKLTSGVFRESPPLQSQ